MDSRAHIRSDSNEPVHVTLLGDSQKTLLGRITNNSKHGIGLLIEEPAPIGSAVKVEWDSTLLLGEVCYCRAEGNSFAIGLELEHALYNTAELGRLAKRLLDEVAPQRETQPSRMQK